jgi:hypothetical protein
VDPVEIEGITLSLRFAVRLLRSEKVQDLLNAALSAPPSDSADAPMLPGNMARRPQVLDAIGRWIERGRFSVIISTNEESAWRRTRPDAYAEILVNYQVSTP